LEYAGRITVEDASGARFQVHEFRGRRFFWRARRFVLETGELVKRVDFDHYVIGPTGEVLLRIEE
jgi:hypothetical protein